MTEQITIATVVEVKALPVLLRRIAHEHGIWNLHVPQPIRKPRSRLVRPGGIEEAVLQASYHVSARGGILILIDADDDCPASYGPELLERARKARGDKSLSVVLANREFEAWFLAAAPSLAGYKGLANPLERPPAPRAHET